MSQGMWPSQVSEGLTRDESGRRQVVEGRELLHLRIALAAAGDDLTGRRAAPASREGGVER